MKIETLKKILNKKNSKVEFSIVTNLNNCNSEIFEPGQSLSKEFENYRSQIENYFKLRKNGIIEGTELFVHNYVKPINVFVVGAVHIAQHLIDLVKNLNFEITVIDPRNYFTSKQKFSNVNIINEWPEEALKKIETNSNSALVALTHDPKIDDPAINHAIKNKFFYIGALGSKKTHANRCNRLKENGFSEEEIQSIHGPIGIKLGGNSAAEIALSIISQLVLETNKRN